MNAKTKNIVFDWNSTLLDDIHALHECTNKLLESEGHKPMTIDFFRAHYTIPFDQLYRNMGFDETQIEKLMSLENSAFHDHYEPMANEAGLREGAMDILSYASKQGVQNVILSNHLTGPIRTQLRRLDIEYLFAEVLAYASRALQFKDMTKGERLRRFMAERAARPGHTMIVGDSVEEIQIAREQGLISVAITGGCVSEERLLAEKPDHLIHSLHELKPIMEQRGFMS
jgi:phosphoglycolate phosphatase